MCLAPLTINTYKFSEMRFTKLFLFMKTDMLNLVYA